MKKFMTLCVLVGLCVTITTSGYGWEATTDRVQTGGYCARSKNYHVQSSTTNGGSVELYAVWR